MLILGHVGLGKKLSEFFLPPEVMGGVILGTLLPDLIDKILFYSAPSELIGGTRTFGHTALGLSIVLVLGYFFRSPFLKALGMGIATHLFFDHLSDAVTRTSSLGNADRLVGLFWPFFGNYFPETPYEDAEAHLSSFWSKRQVILCEIAGALFLLNDYLRWRSRRQGMSR